MIFYFDEMLPRAVATQLTESGHEVIMAVDVGMTQKDDLTEHLTYATEHSAVLATLDRPFAGRAAKESDHAGVICWTGRPDHIGGMVKAFSRFADEHTPEDVKGKVFWLK